MKNAEFKILGNLIADLVDAKVTGDAGVIVKQSSDVVAQLCADFPIFGN